MALYPIYNEAKKLHRQNEADFSRQCITFVACLFPHFIFEKKKNHCLDVCLLVLGLCFSLHEYNKCKALILHVNDVILIAVGDSGVLRCTHAAYRCD